VLPFYHTISDETLPHVSHLYKVRSTKQFIADLEYLCKYYTPVDLDSLHDIIDNNRTVSQPIFHISFDDGLKEIYSNIAPILNRKGIPASVFLNTDFIDNKGLFFRYKVSLIIHQIHQKKIPPEKFNNLISNREGTLNSFKSKLMALTIDDSDIINGIAKAIDLDFKKYLKDFEPYLNRQQIKELSETGFKFGSHSLNHPFFKLLPIEEQKKQVVDSFDFIAKELNIRDRYFSFPFSDENIEADFFKWLYSSDCRLSFGISGMKSDSFNNHLHRIPFDGINHTAKEIINSEYLYYIIKFFFNKNQIRRY